MRDRSSIRKLAVKPWIDSADAIYDRVELAVKHLAPERITLNPDCGFAPGSAAVAWLMLGEPFPRAGRIAVVGHTGRDRHRRNAIDNIRFPHRRPGHRDRREDGNIQPQLTHLKATLTAIATQSHPERNLVLRIIRICKMSEGSLYVKPVAN